MKAAESPRPLGTVPPTSGYFGPEGDGCLEEVDPEVRAAIDTYVAEHPGSRERLIPLLHLAQAKLGYLPFSVQEYIADKLGISPVQVYGVVSFYHFFTTMPRGRFQIKVCTGTACFVQGAMNLIEELHKQLGLNVGEVSADHNFGLEQVRCIGACGLAPAMLVNDQVYGNLTKTKVKSIVRRLLKELNAGEPSEDAANGEAE